MKVDLSKKSPTYRACVEALIWFEETIGHDGAPDGGDPGWVNEAVEAIAREDGLHYGPDFQIHVDGILRHVLGEEAAGRR